MFIEKEEKYKTFNLTRFYYLNVFNKVKEIFQTENSSFIVYPEDFIRWATQEEIDSFIKELNERWAPFLYEDE